MSISTSNGRFSYPEFEKQRQASTLSIDEPTPPKEYSTRALLAAVVMAAFILGAILAALLYFGVLNASNYRVFSAVGFLGSFSAAAVGVGAALVALKNLQATVYKAQLDTQNQQAALHQQYLALSVQVATIIEQNFKSERMLELRRQVSQLLLKKSVLDEWARSEFDALAEVLGVFELAASYANRRGIDKEIVFNQYYFHMYTYWYFAEPHLRSALAENPLIFKELDTLLKEFHAFYEYSYTIRELPFPGLPPRQLLKDFLEDETKLQHRNGTPGMEGGNGV